MVHACSLTTARVVSNFIVQALQGVPISIYFDENRFTGAGNRIVAQRLFDYLAQKGLIDGSAGGSDAKPAAARESR